MNVVTQFPAARDYDRELRFQAMFEGAAIGIGICGLDGRILEANPALSRMLGYSAEELAGTHAAISFRKFTRFVRKFIAKLAARFIPAIFRPTNDGWASCCGANAARSKLKNATGAKTVPSFGDI